MSLSEKSKHFGLARRRQRRFKRSATQEFRLHSLVRRIIQLYGLKALHVLPTNRGYRNISAPVMLDDGTLINVMIYKHEPGMDDTIRRADAVSDYLAERGLPTRHSLYTRIAQISTGTKIRYAKIYDYLPGVTIPWEAYSRGHIVALGADMSKMHELLQGYATIGMPDAEQGYSDLNDRMQQYFADHGVRNSLETKLGVRFDHLRLDMFRTLFAQCRTLEGRHALHLDFVRGNILFDGSKEHGIPRISGILDFEKTAVGYPLFDVGRTLAFLLVDCKYKTSEQVTKYFLDSGYNKRGATILPKVSVKTLEGTHDLLALLMDFFLLHDFYKFLRHNPYESLAENHHYVRTRDILHARNLIDVF